MERFVKFARLMDNISNIDALFDMFSLTTQSFGIDYICYFVVSPKKDAKETPYFHVFGNFPSEWADYYFENDFVKIDPIIQYARTSHTPFCWFDLFKMMKMSKESKAYLEELYNAGFQDGMSFPIFGAYGQAAIFGFSKKTGKFNFSDQDIQTLKHICMTTHDNYIRLTKSKFNEMPSLSQRELSVLYWISQGKSDSDIAGILEISVHTVDTYLRRIYQKLGVANRISAAIRAICLGLLIPADI